YATIKYGSDGEEKWVRRYNGPENSYDEAYAIAVDDSGNVYVTGKSYATNYDYATIKYNPEGNSLWVRTYKGPGNGIDVAQAIAVDDSGNVYVTGRSTGSGTGNDYATIKYNPEGDALWVRRYNGPANGSDGAQAIAVDEAGNVYVTGGSTGSGTGCDYATIKYHSAGPGVSEDLCGNVFSQIMIQPNPVRLRRIVAVRYALPKAGPVSFKLYDITGAMVKSYSNSTPTRDGILLIDAKDLSAGVYILRFNSGAIRATRKLVIQGVW
ncbi:MAG: SBBP repeat-containing protein, partial [candidate division WOR-3 bacterium]|nr:SBBP repeat-containing protein [candidate division WOR-3 bacterium]